MMRADTTCNAAEIKRRMQKQFETICRQYDFSEFTLESFAAWVEQRRGKAIHIRPWPMPTGLFGAWVETNDIDFIFYHQDVLPLHQLHIQLHELAHILCGHPTLQVTDEHVDAFLSGKMTGAKLLLRCAKSNQAEQEAEMLTGLIQEQIHRQARFHEWTQAITADDEQRKFFNAMGMLD